MILTFARIRVRTALVRGEGRREMIFFHALGRGTDRAANTETDREADKLCTRVRGV